MADRVAGSGSNRVPYSGAAAGGGSSPGGGSSVGTSSPVANGSGGNWPEGGLLALTATGYELLDVTNANLKLARFALVVTQAGGVLDGASGTATALGEATVRFKAGLTPENGDLVFGSTTPGEATHGRPGGGADLDLNPPPAGALIEKIGQIVDASGYGANQTAVVLLDKGIAYVQGA